MTKTEQLQGAIEILSGGKRALREMLEEKKSFKPDTEDPRGYHWLKGVGQIIDSLLTDIQAEEREAVEKRIRELVKSIDLDVQLLTKEGKQLKSKSTGAKKLDRVVIITKNKTFIVTGARGRNKPDIKKILDKEGEKERWPVRDACPEIPNGVISLDQYHDLLNAAEF